MTGAAAHVLPGDHPLTGAGAPDLVLADGSRLGDRLHTGRALLLDLADDPALYADFAPAQAEAIRSALRILAGRTGEGP
ncbi:hypothetical protein AB0M41_11670 [Streptomyces sp. NPDC051896]|uniref:hypothetical protein n=1 Tax=Streptomyces sp. NPDC051896 TaxID=3155416 RepID=UPI0034209A40